MASTDAYELLSHRATSGGDLSLQTSQQHVLRDAIPNTASTSPSPLIKPQHDEPDPAIYKTYFSRRKQFLKLLFNGFLRFCITIFLIGCIYATLAAYGGRSVIGPVGKRVFNALVTGLSMILGISIASSFKAIAVDIRWWILSRKRRPIHEVNL